MITTDAMEVMLLELCNTLKISDRPLMLHILIKLPLKLAKPKLEFTKLTVSVKLLDVQKLKLKFKEDHWLLELMHQTGRLMLQVYSTTVEMILTTLFSWLVQVKILGLLRTHGVLDGENKDTLDWLRVTHAVSVKDHHSQFDFIMFESLSILIFMFLLYYL